MEMFSGGSVDSFISATALVWAALIILIMVGIVYFSKEKERKNTISENAFVALYFTTLLLNILEFSLYFIMRMNDGFVKTLTSKVYVFVGFVWCIIVIFYIASYVAEAHKRKVNNRWLYLALTLVILSLICCIIFPITVELEPYGKYYTLSGTLNTIYNRFGIISNFVLLIFTIRSYKTLSKTFTALALFIFAAYLTNFALEAILHYAIKESIFTYSLLVLSLFNTTANQDKQLLTDLNEAKITSEKLNRERDLTIYKFSNEIRSLLNSVIASSDDLILSNTVNSKELSENSYTIQINGIELSNYIDNILNLSKIQGNNTSLEVTDFELNTLINEINDVILPLTTSRRIEFKCMYENNLPTIYSGDYEKTKKLILNLIFNAVNNTTSGEVNVFFRGKRLDTSNVELYIIVNGGVNNRDDILTLELSDLVEKEESINNSMLSMIVAKKYSELLNGELSISLDDENKTNYIFKINQKYIQ